MMKSVIVFLSLVTLFTLIGCTGNSSKTTQSVQFFPVQKEKPEAVMEVLLQGELVLDDAGYLRVYNELILWPYGYSCKMDGETLWIIDDEGINLAKVGDYMKIGGGEIPGYWAAEKIGQLLPEGCEGPYWLTGHIVK